MFFRLTSDTTTASATGLAVVRHAAAKAGALIIAGNAVAGCQLDFQLDDFIPLFICPITLGNRQELPQTTTIVVGRRRGRQNNGRVFWV